MLSEQQQQVADAMSIGSTKCLQAALHGWLLHVLSVYWRVWAGVRLRRARTLTLTLTRPGLG